MRHSLFYLTIIFLFHSPIAECQLPVRDTPEVLEQLFDQLTNNYNDKDRLAINDSIMMILDSYVSSDTVFNHRFENLRYLGQVTSPDSLVKIVSWNLILEDQPGRYYSYFIRKKEHGNKVYKLTAGYSVMPVKTDTTCTDSDWYGALYYDLRPCPNGGQCWVLLGLVYGNREISRKIIDVVNFTSNDSIIFGQKCFVSRDEKKFRVVLEYASSAMISLRFTSDSTIVFDHLVPFSASENKDKLLYGPDYSYDSYNFEDGMWKLKINVDARNKE